jgi:PAS domain S-box-containing protein
MTLAVIAWPRTAAALSVAVGAIALAGWVLDIRLLTSLSPDWPTMKANTASCFVLVGVSLWLPVDQPADERADIARHLQRVCALAASLIALITLLEYALGRNLGIDELLVSDAWTGPSADPGRMSPATAVNFALIGFALLLLGDNQRRSWRLAELLTGIAALTAFASAIAYMYGSADVVRVSRYTDSLGLTTATTFLVVAAGVFAASPNRWFVGPLIDDRPGSKWARWTLPLLVLGPLAVAWVQLHGERAGLFGTGFGVSLMTSGAILTLSALAWWSARSLNRNDAERARVQEKVTRFFALSPDMLCVAGFDGFFKQLNPAWETALGYSRDDLLAEPYLDFIHPDDREATIGVAATLSEDSLPISSFRNRYRCRDGSYKWLEWNSTPAPGEQQIYAVARDMTAQEAAKAALSESEARQRAVIDNMAEGVILVDPQGSIESFNTAAEVIFGYRASEVIGQDVSMLMPEPFAGGRGQRLRDYLKDDAREVISIRRETEGRRKSGERFPLELAVSEIARGDQRAFVGIARDVSERRRAENEIRTLNESLEQQVLERTAVAERRLEELTKINGELDAFTYSVAHDLKEPLRTIEAFSGFLVQDHAEQLDDDGKDLLGKLANASVRMKHLIESLLALSRIGRLGDSLSPTDIRRIVADVVDGMSATLAERRAVVTVAEDIPMVLADPTRVEQIFGNLIGNAIKFNRSEGPCVSIGVRSVGSGQAVLFVRDNGIGIEPEYQERVFGVFQRLHRREEYEGNGAGLAIVKRSVDSLGGRIWVESQPGAGATFLFTLPLAADENGSGRAAA